MSGTNTFDWQMTISAITLIVAIVSPVLVTIINNFHATEIRKLELRYEKQFSYYNKQQDVFNTFLEFASKQLETNYQSERIEYIRSYHELFLYTPEKYWKDFEELNNSFLSRDKSIAQSNLSSVTKILGKILQESDLAFPKL